MYPTPDPAVPTKPTTLEDVKAVMAECQQRHDILRALQAQQRRIQLRRQHAVEAVFPLIRKSDGAKRDLEAALGGETEADVHHMKVLKDALDDAEFELHTARKARDIVKAAEGSITEKIREADKEFTASIIAVSKLATGYFNTQCSRNSLWAAGAEAQFAWRSSILTALLNRLTVGDFRDNLRALEAFLTGQKFTVTVKNGFRYKTSDGLRACVRGESLAVPKALDLQLAFTEIISERLQLVEV